MKRILFSIAVGTGLLVLHLATFAIYFFFAFTQTSLAPRLSGLLFLSICHGFFGNYALGTNLMVWLTGPFSSLTFFFIQVLFTRQLR